MPFKSNEGSYTMQWCQLTYHTIISIINVKYPNLSWQLRDHSDTYNYGSDIMWFNTKQNRNIQLKPRI